MKIIFISHLAKNMLLFRSELLKNLSDQSHEIFVICPDDADCNKFEILGVKHIEWRFNRKGGLLNASSSLLQLVSLFKSIKPDRVVSYMIQPILLSCLASYFVRIDLTNIFTGLGTVFIQRSSVKNRVRFLIVHNLLKILLKKSQRIIVLNKDDYKEVSILCSSEKLYLLPGEGIDLKLYEYENLKHDRIEVFKKILKPKNEKVILYLGRFIKEKGIHDFAKVAGVFKGEKRFHFVAVGECDVGNPSSLNKEEMSNLGDVATIIDWVDDIPELLYNVDLLLYPSQREGFPVGVMEALVCGIPVVGYDVPGVRDILIDPLEKGDWLGLARNVQNIDLMGMTANSGQNFCVLDKIKKVKKILDVD